MTVSMLDTGVLEKWVGRTEWIEDVIDVRPARLMQITLDRAASLTVGDPLPPLWHWLYFPPLARTGDLGHDGHPKLGRFLPPVPLPRRLWAGSRFEFSKPLRLGETARKVSSIKSVRFKQGQSGPLCFVTVCHEILSAGQRRLAEEHDIVYRDQPDSAAKPPAPKRAPESPAWSRLITPSPVLLFRYSALTFNGHRIHYDVDYCRQTEGYPGLVVHGPLTGTLLLELALTNCPGRIPKSYEFKAISPLFSGKPFRLEGAAHGSTAHVWACTPSGELAMDGAVVLA